MTSCFPAPKVLLSKTEYAEGNIYLRRYNKGMQHYAEFVYEAIKDKI